MSPVRQTEAWVADKGSLPNASKRDAPASGELSRKRQLKVRGRQLRRPSETALEWGLLTRTSNRGVGAGSDPARASLIREAKDSSAQAPGATCTWRSSPEVFMDGRDGLHLRRALARTGIARP